ncbi:MAG: 2-dehydro-3-deoxygalactonokinase [Janthinobacterium lividum]
MVGDWGTSSLRLWALGANGGVLGERRSGEGMATLEPGAFEGVLRGHLAALGDVRAVLLCGMVGARQGWREAAYVAVPADVGAVCGRVLRVAAEGLDVRIVPGLSVDDGARCDVMRGEETQLLGLLGREPGLTATVVMPGTHSKWVRLRNGVVAGFETAMTGELYAMLCRHSVLRHSVEAQDGGAGSEGDAFGRGVALGVGEPGGLSRSLFGVRAAGLLRGEGGAHAAAMLSGLLIGAEVGGARPGGEAVAGEVVLVAQGVLAERYGAALRGVGCAVRVLDAEELSRDGLLHVARRVWPERLGDGR